jgi:hypothetical protein
MVSARTSLGEVRTRRRSRRAAGPSASARRATSSQNTGARAYQRPGRQASCQTKLLDRLEVESKERRESATDVRLDRDGMAAYPTTVTPLILAAHTCLL